MSSTGYARAPPLPASAGAAGRSAAWSCPTPPTLRRRPKPPGPKRAAVRRWSAPARRSCSLLVPGRVPFGDPRELAVHRKPWGAVGIGLRQVAALGVVEAVDQRD